MPPRKEPWWHARSGVIVALVVAMGGGWINDKVQAAKLDERASTMPDRRDRELDQLIARVAALEARCNP